MYELPAHIHIYTIPGSSVNGLLACQEPCQIWSGFSASVFLFCFHFNHWSCGSSGGEADGSSEFLVLLQLSWNWVDLNWAVR